METNSKVKVYRVCLYKDNTITVSEFDGEGISDTLKRKVEVFEDFNGNVGRPPANNGRRNYDAH